MRRHVSRRGAKVTGDGQQLLGFIESERKASKRLTGYEYAVLVTTANHEILSLGQLYRAAPRPKRL